MQMAVVSGTVLKKKLMEFSIKLVGSVLDAPVFLLKKIKINMVLTHFILPEEHFKANLFFSHYDPP